MLEENKIKNIDECYRDLAIAVVDFAIDELINTYIKYAQGKVNKGCVISKESWFYTKHKQIYTNIPATILLRKTQTKCICKVLTTHNNKNTATKILIRLFKLFNEDRTKQLQANAKGTNVLSLKTKNKKKNIDNEKLKSQQQIQIKKSIANIKQTLNIRRAIESEKNRNRHYKNK